MSNIYSAFTKSKYLTTKYKNYFAVYEKLLKKYVNTKFTFVEIGVLNGGSLLMWKDFFGESARIIGIDLNPNVKKFENDGFEIFIGNQSDPIFWDKFFKSTGKVDVILDDGGHTNEQKIITSQCCIPNIKDDGMLIIEDTHASYSEKFDNPSKYSFINYSKKVIDDINFRFPNSNKFKNSLNNYVYSIQYFESLVCFIINQKLCIENKKIDNKGTNFDHLDFRFEDNKNNFFFKIKKKYFFLKKYWFARATYRMLFNIYLFFFNKRKNKKIAKYFE